MMIMLMLPRLVGQNLLRSQGRSQPKTSVWVTYGLSQKICLQRVKTFNIPSRLGFWSSILQ